MSVMWKDHPMFPRKWIKAEDVEEKDTVLTIKSLAREMHPKPPAFKEEAEVIVMRFEELADREGKEEPHLMIIKPTNAGLIAKATGENHAENWPGHRITLHATPVSTREGMQLGLRVRDKAPPKKRARKPKPHTEPEKAGAGAEGLDDYAETASGIDDPKVLTKLLDGLEESDTARRTILELRLSELMNSEAES